MTEPKYNGEEMINRLLPYVKQVRSFSDRKAIYDSGSEICAKGAENN